MHRQSEQTHTVLSDFPFGNNSQASYSLKGADNALVFVHGYRGASVKTWIEFPELMSGAASFEDLDFIFWGYDSVGEHTDSCADRFKHLLENLLTKPAGPRRPVSIARSRSGPYQRLLVVAHSMGAVVARRALILADEAKARWTPKVRLVFYAPAHHGARLELADSFLPSLLGGIWTLAQYRSPAINQLRPSSPYLRDFSGDVAQALRKTPKPQHLIALGVIHARREKILLQPEKRFGEDPVARLIDGTHSTVCKPTSTTRDALEELRAIVRRWR